jgi:hypothetical protein
MLDLCADVHRIKSQSSLNFLLFVVLNVLHIIIININMKMMAFWDIAPCNLIEVDQCFGDVYCLVIRAVSMPCAEKIC